MILERGSVWNATFRLYLKKRRCGKNIMPRDVIKMTLLSILLKKPSFSSCLSCFSYLPGSLSSLSTVRRSARFICAVSSPVLSPTYNQEQTVKDKKKSMMRKKEAVKIKLLSNVIEEEKTDLCGMAVNGGDQV